MANIIDSLFDRSFSSLDFVEKLQIKELGRPKPQLKLLFLRDKSKNRSFNPVWYERVEWLTGSDIKNKLFCWPCILFPSNNSNDVWQLNGFNDLKNLSRCLKRHGLSKDHIAADIKLTLLGENRIEHAVAEGARVLNERHNERVRGNREVLKRLIDLTSLLSRQELAFRGHDEGKDSANKGNYREMYEMWSKHDTLLKSSIQNSVSFTSSSIQNDLIQSLTHVVTNHIKKEISETPFFSWEIDETTDIACKSQVSIIIRFTNEMGYIVERFMGFFDVSAGRDALSLKVLLDKELTKFNFKDKLVAQTYDGAAVMSSELNGLQAKVKADAPQAIFIHCYAHRLNLVLSKGASEITESRIFFANLLGLFTFFSKSTKRTHLLDRTQTHRVPSNAPTRWITNSKSVSFVFYNRDKLINVFENILVDPAFDGLTINEASGFLHTLNKFEFVFLLYVYKSIFDLTDVVYDILQSVTIDISYCTNRVTKLIKTLQDIRECKNGDNFSIIYEKISNEIVEPPRRRKIHTNFTNIKEEFLALYNQVFDNIIVQLQIRFADSEKLCFLELVEVSKFQHYKTGSHFPHNAITKLRDIYGKYFDFERLSNELRLLYQDEGLSEGASSTETLLQLFMKRKLDQSLPETTKLLRIANTIPATSASTERSFSCLKRIKSYTRNSMLQDRLSSLALLSIEKKLVKDMEDKSEWYDDVTNYFASMHTRKADFFFK